MSQFENPYGDVIQEEPRTSGLAITSLVLGLIGVIPCLGLITAPIGILLGLIGVATIGPPKKGKGLAVVGLIAGVLSLMPVHYLYYTQVAKPYFFEPFMGMMGAVMEGPTEAMSEGFNGNIATFKSEFSDADGNTTDEEAQAFIDTLRERYGEFISSQLDQTGAGAGQPPFGAQSFTMPYLFTFENTTVSAEAEIVMTETSGGESPILVQYGYVLILDPDLGDLRYPPLPSDTMDDASSDESGEADDAASGG